MSLKNAAAVCLISLFSATLVVLIARTLDNQAASQLQPQLTSIAEELRAMRKQGGPPAGPSDAAATDAVSDGLVVYYLHSNTRCPTCRSIEAQARQTVEASYASQLSKGEMSWRVVNYDQPAGKPLAARFKVEMPVVVLARMKDGQVEKWIRLDQVWALVGDKPGFTKYVREEIDKMLSPQQPAESEAAAAPDIPIPQ
jgi:hypothetical protein